MRKIRWVFLLALFPALLAAQNVDNTQYVKDYLRQHPTWTVGQGVTAAQAACNPDTAIPCVIVLDPSLVRYSTGTLPTKCLQCVWLDYRNGAPYLPTGGGTLSGAVVGPSSTFTSGTFTTADITTANVGALSLRGAPIWSANNGLAFIGDSLSCQQGGWQALVQPLSLQKIWTEFLPSWNQCLAGQTTTYMLTTELPAILALDPKPNFVSILGGTNDYLSGIPLSTTLSNITSMVTQLEAAGITPVLNTVPPNNDPTFAADAYAMNFGTGSPSSPLSPSLESTAASLGVAIVDNWSALADTGTHQYLAGYTVDGEHPNQSGYTTMASNWITKTSSVFAAGSVWLPTNTQDRVNLAMDPFVSTLADWTAVQFSNFTTGPTFSTVSCSLVSVGQCFQAVITSDGNNTHYAQFGPGFTSNANAGDLMLMVLPYTASGMNALGGWTGGIAGLQVITGNSSNANPFVIPWPQIWQDCAKCYLAVEYTQPPLPASGDNVGFEFYFGGSTNSGAVTLQFGQAAIVDLTTLAFPGNTMAFTQPDGTNTNELATTAFVQNAANRWAGHGFVAVIGTDAFGNFLATPTSGTGNAVFSNTPQIDGAPQISVGGTFPNEGFVEPTAGGIVQANQILSGSSLPATCTANGFNVFFSTSTLMFYYCSASNTWSPIPSVSASATAGHAACLKAISPLPVVGSCSTQPDASGLCTCN